MKSIGQQRIRSSLLAVTSIGVTIVAIYSFIVPSVGKLFVADFVFPKRIPLIAWQQKNSYSLTTKAKLEAKKAEKAELDSEIVKSAHSYNYIQDSKNLTIEMRYLVGSTGNIDKYLRKYTNIATADFKSKQIKNIERIGYHVLFTSGNRAYLSSCIVAQGNSKVNPQQFSQQLNKINLQAQVWLDWLTVKEKVSIRDRRCLWTHLSLSLNNSSPQLAYQTLETIWVNWYQWWKPQFPKL